MLNAFLTNLGKYNEGELCGLWVELPATEERLKEAFKDAQIDGVQYEEYFITDYDSDIDGLIECLGEYENIRELNYLAEKLDDLKDYEIKTYEAALAYEGNSDINYLINLTDNLDNYTLCPDIQNETDLGYYCVEELGMYRIPDELENYIDYEAIGRDFDIDGSGSFTSNGYLMHNGDHFTEYYNGPEDLPDYEPPEPDISDGPTMKM